MKTTIPLRAGLYALTLGLLFTTTALGSALVTHDPPRIVPWHMIGNIGVGMTRARISYSYGVGYPGGGSGYSAVYRADTSGHVIAVTYSLGNAWRVSTDSPRYRTSSGFGVGSRVPLGLCHPRRGGCVHLWNGFTYNPQTHEWWLLTRHQGRLLEAILSVSQGRVTAVTVQAAPQ